MKWDKRSIHRGYANIGVVFGRSFPVNPSSFIWQSTTVPIIMKRKGKRSGGRMAMVTIALIASFIAWLVGQTTRRGDKSHSHGLILMRAMTKERATNQSRIGVGCRWSHSESMEAASLSSF
jgi:hypothetical protein